MEKEIYNPLQLRELFHLEFLRWLGRKIRVEYYALKGGTNLRFFFKSFRYSEDMDLDIRGIKVASLKDAVMKILKAQSFQNSLKPFGIKSIVPPNMAIAKQTETTQRFKIHLISSAGEDLFTKVEFSRRGFKGDILVEPVLNDILRFYKLPPLLVPHYDIRATMMQKINALAARTVTQARDIFDLYILSSQYSNEGSESIKLVDKDKLSKAYDNLFELNFEKFKDTVIFYLAIEEQRMYNSASTWEEVKLRVANLIEQFRKKYA